MLDCQVVAKNMKDTLKYKVLKYNIYWVITRNGRVSKFKSGWIAMI